MHGESNFDTVVHAKRAASLVNGATGVMLATRAAIHAIGAAYAEVAEIKPRHGVENGEDGNRTNILTMGIKSSKLNPFASSL